MNSYERCEKAILDFPRQLNLDGIKLYNEDALKGGGVPDAVIFAGLGGSGLIGDLVKFLAPNLELPVPVETWKDYDLPFLPYKNPLIIAVSFSGNTEETVAALEKAADRKLRAAIAGGGQLQEMAMKNGIAFATFPASDLEPRQSLGYIFSAGLKILKIKFPGLNTGVLKHDLQPADYRSKGEELAKKVHGFIPVIYAASANQAIAQNWKIRFNETGKIPAFANVLPEMNHNEIVGFTNEKLAKNFLALFLTDENDHPRVKKRFQLTENILKRQNINSLEIALEGRDRPEKFWRAIILADWVSVALAKIEGVDPLITPMITELKTAMGKL